MTAGLEFAPMHKITFAPNLTPCAFASAAATPAPEIAEPAEPLFPPAPAPRTARTPHSKRRPQNHIPRPPNSFILFRSAFIKSQHVPGTIESNHGSLSKIIGLCWRNLGFEERAVWEAKARAAQAAHKAKYPHYRFRPTTATPGPGPQRTGKHTHLAPAAAEYHAREERKIEDVAMLLMEGKKGEELEAAVRELEKQRQQTPPKKTKRRSSSAPLPDTSVHAPQRASCPSTPTPVHFPAPVPTADVMPELVPRDVAPGSPAHFADYPSFTPAPPTMEESAEFMAWQFYSEQQQQQQQQQQQWFSEQQPHYFSFDPSPMYATPAPVVYAPASQYDTSVQYTPSPMQYAPTSPVDYSASSPVDFCASSPVDYSASSPVDYSASSPVDYTASSPVDYAPSPVDYAPSPIDYAISSPIDYTAPYPTPTSIDYTSYYPNKPLFVPVPAY